MNLRSESSIRRHLPVLAALAALIIITNVFAIRFVDREHTLYVADHVAYWSFSADLATHFRASPWSAVSAVARSVAHDPLNLLPAAPPAAIMAVAGSSRLVYILALLNLYAIPSLVMLFVLVRRLLPDQLRAPRVLWATATTVLLFPVFWYPVVQGYVGVGGVVLCLGALLLYLGDEGSEPSALTLVAIGFLIALVFLFRRWYGIWAVAFGATVVVDAAVSFLTTRPRSTSSAIAAIRKPAIIAATALATLAATALPIVRLILRTDYGDRFAAYDKHHTLVAELGAAVAYLGAVAVVIFLVSAVALIRDHGQRRAAVFLTLHIAIAFAVMRRVQDPTDQHWYLFLPGMMCLVAIFLVQATDALLARRARAAALCGLTGLGILATAWVVAAPRDLLRPLFPWARIQPQTRNDLAEIRRLLSFIDRTVEAQPGFIYVIGATPTMSANSLGFANLSLDEAFASPRLILASAHMDRRDGFPSNLLMARYVVVTSPIQCRQPPVDQLVVEIPGRSLLEGRDIGRAFTRLPEVFHLTGGVEAYVYRRERNFEAEELNTLVGRLREAYPDRPEIFSPGGLRAPPGTSASPS